MDKMTVKDLKILAKSRGLRGYSRLRKTELIQRLKPEIPPKIPKIIVTLPNPKIIVTPPEIPKIIVTPPNPEINMPVLRSTTVKTKPNAQKTFVD